MTRLFFSIAATAAIVCLEVPPGQAQTYGDAPWCAVIAATDGDVIWHCYYRSAEECQPHVLAGDRGFCNVNPYGASSQTAPPAAAARHRKQHDARRD
jgi:hypothetical protein